MPVVVFYNRTDGAVVGWRESDYPGDPTKEAGSRGTGIAYLVVTDPPKSGYTARVVDGILVETPLPPVPGPRASILSAIQNATTVSELKQAVTALARFLGFGSET